MSIAEKVQDVKFTKSVAGYSTKEVDGFLGDILPLLIEQEQLLKALRVKLDAVEYKADEITKRENESVRTLEKAKENAAAVVESAKLRADEIIKNAETKAQTLKERTAEACAAKLSEAEKNAAAILAVADKKGKDIVAAAAERAEAQNAKAAALVAESEAFEARFRTLVAETVSSLNTLCKEAPKVRKSADAQRRTVKVQQPEEKVTEIAAPKEEAAPEREEPRDYNFAGGMPVGTSAQKSAETPRRRLYDTVTVTYDTDNGFEDIRKLKEESGAKNIKSPIHFSE